MTVTNSSCPSATGILCCHRNSGVETTKGIMSFSARLRAMVWDREGGRYLSHFKQG